MTADDKRWILVLGATGRQGGSAARHLLDRGWTVHALVRDPDKPAARELAAKGAVLVPGEFDDREAVRSALAGAYGLFTVFTPTHGNGLDGEERHARLFAEEAGRAGVRHLVHSSVGGVEKPGGVGWRETKLRAEQAIGAAGVPTTLLRPVYFMENFLDLPPEPAADGTLVFRRALYPHTKLQVIASQDMGHFVADAFDDPDSFVGRSLEVAGEALTGPEIAAAFAAHTGRPARYEFIPLEELAKKDVWMAKTFEWFNDIGYRADIPALRAAHPDLLTFADLLRRSGWTPPNG
ncbi:NmrA/HSCARG family protein [Streptomyces humi]|uniref:NmrA/HSCARG family protein n=1 Tax=Streptomyces humi TaxID=1428620 RepID=UPI0006287EB4|nr:NmrA/HSCARG family protein [Streptomyces humi]